MDDVKRMTIRGSDHIEREYVPAGDYDALARKIIAEIERAFMECPRHESPYLPALLNTLERKFLTATSTKGPNDG